MNLLEERVLRLIGESIENPDVFVDIQDSDSDSADIEKDQTYLQAWEVDYVTGDALEQVLRQWPTEEAVISHRWEDRFGFTVSENDEEQGWTQPFEAGGTDHRGESPLELIRGSINDAIQEICMASGAYKRTYHLAMKTGAMFYRMDWGRDYFGWVTQAWDRSRQSRLTHVPIHELCMIDADFLKTSGPPACYFQVGTDIVGIYYKPSADDAVIELTCAVIPMPYTEDTDPVRLRDSFEDAAAYFAVSEFFASRGDAQRASQWHGAYLESAGLAVAYPEGKEREWVMVKPAGGNNNG